MEAVQERKGRTRNMTTGDPVTLILGFAIPMLFGTLFQQFYSMADTIIVGRFLGVDALAGVGSTAAVNFMVNGFVIGTCSGFSVPVSQRFGAGDYKDMRKFIGSLIWLTAVIAVVLTALAALMTRRILVFMSTPDNIIDYAYRYIFIIFLGIPATYLYNSTACVIRALGDSKTPVLFLVLTSLINIVLDYVSIVFFGFSVDGPALATVAAQAFSGILCVFYMKKKFPVLRFEAREMHPDGRKCAVLLGMGLPMGLQYSVTAIGSVILQTAVNSLGSAAVASITAGQKIHMFCCCVFDALGGTMAT
ncbi:MAG: MATE family efflux transporter, partial [Stomatobaculum sp.]|nr:MATE family efflux transporter [Stomatobaculum sp.]